MSKYAKQISVLLGMLYQYRAAVIIRGVTSAKHLRRNFLIKWVTAFICWIFSHKNSISYVFCTFSEHLLLRAPLDSCFCPYLRKICLNKPYWIMNLMMKTWCSFLRIVILIKSRKSVISYLSNRNWIWEFPTDNAGVWGVLKTLSNICDWASLWK